MSTVFKQSLIADIRNEKPMMRLLLLLLLLLSSVQYMLKKDERRAEVYFIAKRKAGSSQPSHWSSYPTILDARMAITLEIHQRCNPNCIKIERNEIFEPFTSFEFL